MLHPPHKGTADRKHEERINCCRNGHSWSVQKGRGTGNSNGQGTVLDADLDGNGDGILTGEFGEGCDRIPQSHGDSH